MNVSVTTVRNILTRTSGYLKTVTSHSLQPYRGCSFGNSLCGIGCYVQHNGHLTRGRPWGGFLEVRENGADSYRSNHHRESGWARRARGGFSIFLSSVTEPFLPQEFRYRVTRQVLESMLELPPDRLILQTHSHRIMEYIGLLKELSGRTDLRVHLSIETDRDRIAGLPPHASPIQKRFDAAAGVRSAGIRTVITVSPLLPIASPDEFFARTAECADAVVIDHFIGGDGTKDGSRTVRTGLPEAMEQVHPGSTTLSYRDAIVAVAKRHLPGRVGVSVAGFAGQYDR